MAARAQPRAGGAAAGAAAGQQAAQAQAAQAQARRERAAEPTWEDYVNRIHYSDHYSDDEWQYRHVIIPKGMLKQLPKEYFDSEEPEVLRILKENEWRSIGIQQSMGWVHYEVHAPEPHILLFRRPKPAA
ncbi:cyclin-dependent kinase regulatory subunit [Ceraceosorus bombacis]|uniref:Cyclin-dependent kinases regulatory subunit n=2 Tax=Ceraceosorus TaxID=401624 RepID=A0A0P1BBE4_9BASI|nr:CKS-domain-containing protein [Ceraceosorus guamensis]PWN42162.1 CKS-domain-containing protein [Ceraceosorus guamensis]CEH12741.1 cyclin-dependent kinase regulatory subunit [Ceraceosorus bombacis]